MPDRPLFTRRQAIGVGAADLGALGLGALGTSPASATPAASAYPKGIRPSTLHVLQESALSPAELTLATTLQGTTLQGQFARSGSKGLYLDIPSLGYHLWLNDLIDRYDVRARPADDLWKLVGRSRVGGYPLYRQGTPSVNVATTLAGLTGAVAIEETPG
jgi:hypothetical protein